MKYSGFVAVSVAGFLPRGSKFYLQTLYSKYWIQLGEVELKFGNGTYASVSSATSHSTNTQSLSCYKKRLVYKTSSVQCLVSRECLSLHFQ